MLLKTLLEPGGIKRDEFLTHLDALQCFKKSDYKLAKNRIWKKCKHLFWIQLKRLTIKPGFLEELQNVTYDGFLFCLMMLKHI